MQNLSETGTFSCVEVNLDANFMFDVAYCWYSYYC